jgi:hypothetical protein
MFHKITNKNSITCKFKIILAKYNYICFISYNIIALKFNGNKKILNKCMKKGYKLNFFHNNLKSNIKYYKFKFI